MQRKRKPSRQALVLFTALLADQSAWRHGYDLSRETGLASGTLYPLLARLQAGGLLEAEWQVSAEPGRPSRHAYRLTAEGRSIAREATQAQPMMILKGALA
ncbi:PadR family transcriptional regulator [Caulobacter sp. RL271]|jgi:DNA-binding PadR family transcriptional regulator|uniref:PadR family transcriptional regulator n=1 Tax=Caulobacter segnis TaxID=88688 RepID=A0ABY4ZWM2_9CAUL|nr:PadR family transcriptional regulator [Caulobacter segnis]USQ96956.1 PadR family transcriptional regulator [Caulobacter segnis]